MPFLQAAKADIRDQAYIMAIDTEYCANTYGQAPCTASGAAGTECRNTFKTCQDKANFVQTNLTYTFITANSNIPPGIIYIPCIMDVNMAPVTKQREVGLSIFASVTIKCQDFPWHDRNADPYEATRPFSYQDQGTFWGRFIASNPYLIGQEVRVYSGFITDPFDLANFDKQTFLLETIDGPDSNGVVTIKLRDPLRALEDNKATWPDITDSQLDGDLNPTATTINVTNIAPFQPAPGYASINNEEIYYTSTHTSQSQLRSVTRGINGVSGSHKDGDTVQKGQEIPPLNCVDVAYNLLIAAGVNPSYIDQAAWNATRDQWFVGFDVERRIYDPTELMDLLRGLCEDTAMSIWWDSRAETIRLKQVAPAQGAKEYTDDQFLADSLRVTPVDSLRINEGWYYYQPRDYVQDRDNPSDFRRLYVLAEPYGPYEYPDDRPRTVYASWVSENGENIARTVTSRMTSRYRETPVVVQFALDSADADLWTGDDMIFNSHVYQDAYGRNLPINCEVYEAREKLGRYEYKAVYTGLAATRLAVIGPDSLGTYASESQANRDNYGFISDNSGLMSDDTYGYSIQ